MIVPFTIMIFIHLRILFPWIELISSDSKLVRPRFEAAAKIIFPIFVFSIVDNLTIFLRLAFFFPFKKSLLKLLSDNV